MAAVGTLIAAFGTLFSFIVIWLQLRLSQSEAIETKHAAITPFFSVDFHDLKFANASKRMEATLDLKPVLNGIANAIVIEIESKVLKTLDFKAEQWRIASLVASATCSVGVSWLDPNPGQQVDALLVVAFTNALGRKYKWQQGLTFKHGVVSASDPPVQNPLGSGG